MPDDIDGRGSSRVSARQRSTIGTSNSRSGEHQVEGGGLDAGPQVQEVQDRQAGSLGLVGGISPAYAGPVRVSTAGMGGAFVHWNPGARRRAPENRGSASGKNRRWKLGRLKCALGIGPLEGACSGSPARTDEREFSQTSWGSRPPRRSPTPNCSSSHPHDPMSRGERAPYIGAGGPFGPESGAERVRQREASASSPAASARSRSCGPGGASRGPRRSCTPGGASAAGPRRPGPGRGSRRSGRASRPVPAAVSPRSACPI